MATIDPVDAALDALLSTLSSRIGAEVTADHGATQAAALAYVRGWSEARRETDPVQVIAVAVSSDITSHPATPVSSTSTDTQVTTTALIGRWDATVEVILACDHRDQRDAFAPYLLRAIDGGTETSTDTLAGDATGWDPPTLRITSTDYYAEPVDFRVVSIAHDGESQAAMLGEWRTVVRLLAEGRVVRRVTHWLGQTLNATPSLTRGDI